MSLGWELRGPTERPNARREDLRVVYVVFRGSERGGRGDPIGWNRRQRFAGDNDEPSGGGWFPGTVERVRLPERVELEGRSCAEGDRDPPEGRRREMCLLAPGREGGSLVMGLGPRGETGGPEELEGSYRARTAKGTGTTPRSCFGI